MRRWYNAPKPDKRIAYNQISKAINLPAFAVEKDWWVTQTLTILFEMEIGKHLVFKGGTSLSKAWGLIERFSEDIDLAVDQSFFQFEGGHSKSQRTKLRKTANTYIVETLYPELTKSFDKKGLIGIHAELEEIKSSDQDPVIISVYYPNVIESPGYIQPRIRIEIGCRSLREPFILRSIISEVDKSYPDTSFAQSAVEIPTIVPERTFLEKIFLLHEEFQRPEEKIRVDRLSRHLYDIFQISNTSYADKALESYDLYETIVKHRFSFTKLGGVNYNLHQPQTINFLPPDKLLVEWEKDYQTMQEQMIHGESPKFNDLINSLNVLKQKINALPWKMDIEFK